MLTEEQQQRRPWNIRRDVTPDMKPVAWPPKRNHEGCEGPQQQQVQQQGRHSSKVAPPVPPKPGVRDEAHAQDEMAAPHEPFTSNELVGDRALIAKPEPPPGLVLRPLKKDSPFTQQESAVVDSQPVFKRATPVRMLGDMVWPPKGGAASSRRDGDSPGPVRRQQKDYRGFFQQHQLPANFPTYRAPPGTQHFGLEEGENATPM